MSRNDFYGDGKKTFVGVVKDIQVPENSNRIRVRIFGIHPDEGEDDYVDPVDSSSTGSSSGDSTSTGGNNGNSSTNNGGTTPSTSGSGSVSPSPIKVDSANLPDARQLSDKISKHFTLASLTVGATGPESRRTSRRGIEQGKLTKEIISNLSELALNCLDPIKDHYGNLTITSGWRIGVSSADRGPGGGNHPKGLAADIQCAGVRPQAMASWVQQNLKGRFSTMFIYRTFIHIQFKPAHSRQGTRENPLVRNN